MSMSEHPGGDSLPSTVSDGDPSLCDLLLALPAPLRCDHDSAALVVCETCAGSPVFCASCSPEVHAGHATCAPGIRAEVVRAHLREVLERASVWDNEAPLIGSSPGPSGPGLIESLRQHALTLASAAEVAACSAASAQVAIAEWGVATAAAATDPASAFDIGVAASSRCEALVADVIRIEAVKAAVFDAELVALDAVLEAATAASDLVGQVARVSDVDAVRAHAPLLARLEAVRSLAARILTPPALLPQTRLRCELPSPAEAATSAETLSLAGAIFSDAVAADDVLVSTMPAWASPGAELAVDVVLSPGCRALATLDAPAAVETLLQHITIDAAWVLQGSDSGGGTATPPRPRFALAALADGRPGVRASLTLPLDCPPGTRIAVHSVCLGSAALLPSPCVVCVGVRKGISAPMTLHNAVVSYQTPDITSSGTIFCPVRCKVFVFEADGRLRGDISCEALETLYIGASLYDEHSNTLLLGSDAGDVSRVAAIDATTHALRWVTPPGSLSNCDAATIIRGVGLIVLCQYGICELTVLRISDGAVVTSLRLPGSPAFVVSDPDHRGVLFVSSAGAVHVLHWDEARQVLVDDGLVEAFGHRSSRPLAVVPAAVAGGVAHLVVGDYNSSIVFVAPLPLPSPPTVPPIRTVRLQKMRVTGLAADAAGGALLVMDARSENGRVLPWPLVEEPEEEEEGDGDAP